MSYETVRISELAKELGLPSKEVVEKFAQIGVTNKTHSSTVTQDQIKRLKSFIADGGVKKTSKPKAFVVKKAKTVETETEKAPKKEVETKPVVEKVERPKIEKVERPKVEVVKPVSRLEIVRRAPRKPVVEKVERPERPSRTGDKKFTRGERPQNGERKFPPRGDRPQKPNSQGGENKDFANKKPLQRRIIPQDIYENKGPVKRKSDGKKKEKDFNSKKEEQERISLEKAAAQHHKKKIQKVEEVKEVKQIVVNQPMTISELSDKIQKTPAEIVKFLMLNGVMATVNQLIDVDVIKKVCAEYEIEVLDEDIDAYIEQEMEKEEKAKALTEVDKKLLKRRAPVISIMGHVDHGKTTLLDSIRASKHKIVASEVGGITQSIGAYTVYLGDKNEKKIVFLDTPGHEAFTEMRARGAKATDIAILVVAADDGIMPQTIEAINHAKAAEIPIIVAVNKVDKPGANPDRVLQQLTEHGLVPEEWGGDTICVPISARTGEGIDNLLEMLLLIADMKDLKANPNKQAKGTVLEARLDKTRGTVVSMLVQRGQLNVGDTIVVGDMVAKVRAMKDDKGKSVKVAGPSTPVEILGLSHVPQTGDVFYEVENEKVAKQLIEKRIAKQRLDLIKQGSKITLDDLFGQIKQGKIKELNIIIKADVQGSVEAMKDSLLKLSNDEVRVRILHASTGGIKESDVTLASVSNAIIIGFNVRPELAAEQQAKKEKVDMRLYSVIYDAINDVETALKGMMPKKYKEVKYGTAEVRKIFKITGVGIVAGCYVKSGKIVRGAMVRLVRDNIVLLEIKIDSLKREKDDVKEVNENYECGIKLENYSDIKEGDIFECFTMEEVK